MLTGAQMTSWVSKRFDKLTNTKKSVFPSHLVVRPRAHGPRASSLDSPAAYVAGLNRLFKVAQLLDDHTKAIVGQPVAHVYAGLPADLRASVEAKLKHLSEFFASVVLTFVIRDLSLLLNKFAKSCEKWLAE